MHIFMSYRHSTSRDLVGRIYDRLADNFGDENIFRDVESIPAGADFRSIINREIGRADALLIIIDPHWEAAALEDGRARLLHDPNDWVRMEIEYALARRSLPIIPVLVERDAMPALDALPRSIHDFTARQALALPSDPAFRPALSRLVDQLKRYDGDNVPTDKMNRRQIDPGAIASSLKSGTGAYDEAATAMLRRVPNPDPTISQVMAALTPAALASAKESPRDASAVESETPPTLSPDLTPNLSSGGEEEDGLTLADPLTTGVAAVTTPFEPIIIAPVVEPDMTTPIRATHEDGQGTIGWKVIVIFTIIIIALTVVGYFIVAAMGTFANA